MRISIYTYFHTYVIKYLLTYMYGHTYVRNYTCTYVRTNFNSAVFFGANQITCVRTYPSRTIIWFYQVVLYLPLNTYYCFSNSKFFSIHIYTKMNIYVHSKIGCLDYSPNSHSPIYPPHTLSLFSVLLHCWQQNQQN